jgi:tetratricopeptide (TPR) repeat protein
MKIPVLFALTLGLAMAAEPSPEPSPSPSPAPALSAPKASVAEEHVKEGIELLKAGKKKEALAAFRKGRKADPSHLSSWFYELRMLRELKKKKEAKKLTDKLLKEHPEFKAMPMFQPVEGE